ncbi:hypothetical protein AHF37_08685 [Paragonimus kellicotti]|nr:hypothetical protein AHF37_08685 [Paragonimus kellicotti]
METRACLKARKNTEVLPDLVEMNLTTVGLPGDIGSDGGPRNTTSSTALRSQASPVRPTLKDCFLYSCREWRCACLTLTIVFCFIGTTFCYLWRHVTNVPLESTHMHSWICCQTTYIAIGAALVFLFYLVYLIECWNCPVWLTANCMVDSTTAYNWINVLRLSVPSIYWHVNCYHYESGQESTKVGTHLVEKLYKIDVNGLDSKAVNTRVHSTRFCKQTGARCGKVITASGIHVFDTSQLEGVWDYSDTVTHLERYPMVQIDIHTDYVFADEVSCQLFTYQRQQFFTNFEDIDEYMETHQSK